MLLARERATYTAAGALAAASAVAWIGLAGYAMGLGWAALIAVVIFVQKALPFGEAGARVAGLTLLVAAIALAVV